MATRARWYIWLQQQLGSNPFTIIFSTAFCAGFGVLIWYLTAALVGIGEEARPNDVSLNRLVALLGALVGWVVGVYFAPFTTAESKQFQGISKVVSAFAAGYLLSKGEAFIEMTLFVEFQLMPWIRAGLFLAAFLLAALIVFVHRLYAFRDERSEETFIKKSKEGAIESVSDATIKEVL